MDKELLALFAGTLARYFFNGKIRLVFLPYDTNRYFFHIMYFLSCCGHIIAHARFAAPLRRCHDLQQCSRHSASFYLFFRSSIACTQPFSASVKRMYYTMRMSPCVYVSTLCYSVTRDVKDHLCFSLKHGAKLLLFLCTAYKVSRKKKM